MPEPEQRMLAIVSNSKVAVIGGAESLVRITKKFTGTFPQVAESQKVAVGSTEMLLLSPFPLIPFITPGEKKLGVPGAFFNHYRIFF